MEVLVTSLKVENAKLSSTVNCHKSWTNISFDFNQHFITVDIPLKLHKNSHNIKTNNPLSLHGNKHKFGKDLIWGGKDLGKN